MLFQLHDVVMVRDWLTLTLDFKYLHRKKSGTAMSGDLDSQAVSPKHEMNAQGMWLSISLIPDLYAGWCCLVGTRSHHPLTTF
jgi:hypothetical protein